MAIPMRFTLSALSLGLLACLGCTKPQPPLPPPQPLPSQLSQPNLQLMEQPINPTLLPNLLKSGPLAETTTQWNPHLLIGKLKADSARRPTDLNLYSLNAIYADSNQNQYQDAEDKGFFNPASTIKVGIAALVLEKLNQLDLPRDSTYQFANSNTPISIAEDIRKALIISDNDATNRLIQFLSFDALNHTIQAKAIPSFMVNRLMLDRGTLTDSPAITLQSGDTTQQLPAAAATESYPCWEKDQTLGNCATAQDLLSILTRITYPQWFPPEQSFNLRPGDRAWLQETLSQTPQQAGFPGYADNYCRFLQPLSQQQGWANLQSKCGVALFSHTYVDTSVIQTQQGDQYFVILALSPPRSLSEAQVLHKMNQILAQLLPQLP
ncbi:serine hydrolase [Lyngbya confervoides]|uniref:Class A beta-lactamase-related serine hydrolase n=1 Tax=Lyngbya confervoides BDU141951 TaxID=1574623 RepID=A0ABD4T5A4_9CYAN|nr:serine hydrolase [Lyngbya confervoides]MCM1983545.1 class A beta-lactamase-related serine hydrolase [Lyngbya confervoides BDU141951]